MKSLQEYNVSVVCVAKDLKKARLMYGPDTGILSIVPCDIRSDTSTKISSLVRGAACVVSTAGNSEVSLTGAYDVDYKGTVKMINACVDSGVC